MSTDESIYEPWVILKDGRPKKPQPSDGLAPSAFRRQLQAYLKWREEDDLSTVRAELLGDF